MRALNPSAVCLLVLAALACEESSAAPERDLLATVRDETARFSSTTAAVEAGYVPDDHCVVHPEMGGMGFHWLAEDLVDPAFDPLQPEALLYAPTPDGGRQLVGVEYIVIDAGQGRPSFDGHPFDEGGVPPLTEQGVPHWSLHVWAHLENADGTFTPFNPAVTCDS